jgi:hypothetical protein
MSAQFLNLVMLGLAPGIHVFGCVDSRVKPGHDEEGVARGSR